MRSETEMPLNESPTRDAPLDAELRAIFRQRLEAEARELTSRVSASTGDPDPKPDTELEAERDVEIILDQESEATLAAIRDALQRLDAGAFGSCTECHELIPIERLMVLPYASRCRDCQGRTEQRR